MTQALKVLDAVRQRFAMRITTSHYDAGGAAIDNHGQLHCRLRRLKVVSKPMPCRFGSVGGPKWEHFTTRPATRTRRAVAFA
ncbi:isocitrate/isopropylmalate family dehydrogenase [Escherichia coli]|nr:isocitrate/isopropylmalate family dehydrogenase [Escherichia coli]